MMSDASSVAVTSTYEDVEKLLFRMCWWAVDKWGGDFYEWLSEAHLAYMIAYERYESTHGASFNTWLWRKVRYSLQEKRRKDQRQLCHQLGEVEVVEDRPKPLMSRVMGEASEDARTVIMLLLDVQPRAVRDPAKVRNHLWRQLKDIGWTVARVTESFDEIREVLTQ
jgi:DNA-directed RNA polymerase specialized sigma24 family protein